jgi:hypothetical protein
MRLKNANSETGPDSRSQPECSSPWGGLLSPFENEYEHSWTDNATPRLASTVREWREEERKRGREDPSALARNDVVSCGLMRIELQETL